MLNLRTTISKIKLFISPGSCFQGNVELVAAKLFAKSVKTTKLLNLVMVSVSMNISMNMKVSHMKMKVSYVHEIIFFKIVNQFYNDEKI